MRAMAADIRPELHLAEVTPESPLFDPAISRYRPTAAEAAARTWVYHPYDRLTTEAGPIARLGPERAGLLMVEAPSKLIPRPYHKKKQALVLSSERHFALEAGERGFRVLYMRSYLSFGDGLLDAQEHYRLPEIVVMRPAERELGMDLKRARRRGLRLNVVADETWLSTEEDFDDVFPSVEGGARGPFLMDRFYRRMRQRTGYLMEESGKPTGGKYSFDEENRKRYRGQVAPPPRPSYAPDEITREVLELTERVAPENFGTLVGFDWPCTSREVQHFWTFALRELLPHFGPYEDAMSASKRDLFHSKVSGLMNLSRILPRQVVTDVLAAYHRGEIGLASAEGFLRQVLGWREFMRHVHRVTDGYRGLDVFYERPKPHNTGATPSALEANLPLPAVYWGTRSGMRCVDTVVQQVIEEGWSHHITRLMVLSNLATLCGFSPRELCDWFCFAYVDAYDWVVEPNVLGMGTYADGGLTATKPYVSGAAYINRMSDYCRGCRYDPKKTLGEDACPFTALYWSFLDKHRERLGRNARMAMPYRTLERKSAAERRQLQQKAQQAIDALSAAPRPKYGSTIE
jgi:deoxyribodipyrimidine photolyase-related protein